jgi:hypothetical protein
LKAVIQKTSPRKQSGRAIFMPFFLGLSRFSPLLLFSPNNLITLALSSGKFTFGVMEYEVLKNINQIIERDSKDTTYKFALLRATIEVIQEKSPYQKIVNNRVVLPVGLLILKWLEYYYPIIEKEFPQRNGDNLDSFTLSFRSLFKDITDFYKLRGGLSVFYSELVRGNLPDEIEDTVFQLCKKLRDTIKD